MKLLALVGLAPAAEVTALRKQLATVRATNTTLAITVTQQRSAIAELALQLNTARDEIDAGENRRSRLQAELDRVYTQHQELVLVYDALVVASRRKDGELTQRCDEQNALIAQLQSERPQIRLVHNEQPLAGENDEETGSDEDEVIVPEHEVEMSGRVIIIAFEGKTHWTLGVDDHEFKVPIHDHAFLDDPSHAFAKGCVVRAMFKETLLRHSDGKPYTKRSLEKVIEVIPPPPTKTQPLFADAPAASKGAK